MNRIIERAAIVFFAGLGVIVGLSALWYELRPSLGWRRGCGACSARCSFCLGTGSSLVSQGRRDKGDATAQAGLGSMYESGASVSQDYVQAHTCFSSAYYGVQDPAIRNVALQLRDEVAARMTPVEIAEAQKTARERKPK
jgi:TPR repeat protein